jgi:hypothetical protein
VINLSKKILGKLCIAVVLFNSCGGNADKKGKVIDLKDSSTIVTEYDSAYLQNKVADLAEVRGTKNIKNINNVDKVMREVDSAKKATAIVAPVSAQETIRDIKGYAISRPNYSIILDGAITKSGSRYIFQTGTVAENMSCQIKGLSEVEVQQRSNSKLSLLVADKTILLDKAGENTTAWTKLTGTGTNFVTLGKMDMPFKKMPSTQIFRISEPYLNKSGIDRKEIKRIAVLLKNTDSDNTEYYQVEPQFIELRISGKAAGKKITDIIRIAK